MYKYVRAAQAASSVSEYSGFEICSKFYAKCAQVVDEYLARNETPEKGYLGGEYYGDRELIKVKSNDLSLLHWDNIDGKRVLGVKIGSAFPVAVRKELRFELQDFIVELGGAGASKAVQGVVRINCSDGALISFATNYGSAWSYIGIVSVLQDNGTGRKEAITYRNI